VKTLDQIQLQNQHPQQIKQSSQGFSRQEWVRLKLLLYQPTSWPYFIGPSSYQEKLLKLSAAQYLTHIHLNGPTKGKRCPCGHGPCHK
jgi:hypothetical protein